MQDFEGVTPNLLARTMETVEGGGIVVLLLSTMASLKDLYSLTMDVHKRLQTPSHQTITGKLSPRPTYSAHFPTFRVSINGDSTLVTAMDVSVVRVVMAVDAIPLFTAFCITIRLLANFTLAIMPLLHGSNNVECIVGFEAR